MRITVEFRVFPPMSFGRSGWWFEGFMHGSDTRRSTRRAGGCPRPFSSMAHGVSILTRRPRCVQLSHQVLQTMQEGECHDREPSARESLISAWIGYAESSEEGLIWACQTLAKLIDDDPAQALAIVLELIDRAPSESVFSVAAAGPLEDLVAFHGRELIDGIERRVEGDEKLRRALTRIWLSPSDLDPTTLDRYRNLGAPPMG